MNLRDAEMEFRVAEMGFRRAENGRASTLEDTSFAGMKDL